MSYGEGDGAIGWRIGEENRGLECMFTMMNSERLLVGVQGVAIAERAYQQARDYARTRVQGVPAGMPRGESGAADRASSRCPPHAAVDARRHRGDAGAEPISPPRRSTRAAMPATRRRDSGARAGPIC